MELYIASGNRHKQQEIAEILPEFDIILPEDKNIVFNPEETGNSFFENAFIKAENLYEITKKPALADDSGICVDALDGKPGIFSARFGSENGDKLSDADRNNYLLRKMAGIKNRACRFVCCIVLYGGKNRFISVQETLEGILLEEPRGKNGFGYDPLVFLPELGKSVAELNAEEKNSLSHRGKAVRTLAPALPGFLSETAQT